MSAGEHVRRELYVLNIYRVLQAVVFLALALSETFIAWMPTRAPVVARVAAAVYLLFALLVLSRTRQMPRRLNGAVSACLGVDVIAALAAALLMPAAHTGIAAMLVINVGAGALLLPPRLAGLFAALAALAMVGQSPFGQDDIGRNLLESGLFGLAYFATAALCYALGNQVRASEALAERRGLDLANLSQVNELIIRRMKTGVLLVDDANRIHQINESAWMLLGNPSADQRDLGRLAPELSRRLYHWMTSGKLDETATQLADGVPEVVPRFSRLAPNDDSLVLIFLDDTSL
ncbi:MAG TPA: two-component sensor histidine kinase, partial [Rhodanobacteraceae bacterium]|nr:two-component sensor histidine kinase [Rhodanobacteraceae bacterium]